jgi:hypothetical protein
MKNIRLFGTQLDLSAGPVTIPQNSNGDEQIVISSFEFNVLSTINIDVQYSIDGVNFTTLYSGLSNTEKRKGGFLWRKVRFTKNSGSTSSVDVNYAQGISANSNTPDASTTGDAEANTTTTRSGALGYSYNGATWDRNRSGLVSVQTGTTGLQNNLPFVVYNVSDPVATNGQVGPLQADSAMRLKTRDMFAPRYENNTLGAAQIIYLPVAAADGSWTPFKNLGANATLNIKSTGGNIQSLYCRSRSAAIAYLQLFNTATVPSAGAVPDFSFMIAIGGSITIGNEFFGLGGTWGSSGWAFGFSSTENTYTAGTAADHSTWIMVK